MRLPDHHDEAAAGPQRAADIAERRDRIGEEHRAVAADRDVEMLRQEAVHLRVAMLEPDVVQSFGCSKRASPRDHRLRDVDPQRAAGCSQARSLARRLTRSAADVEHVLVAANGAGRQQGCVMRL